MLKKTGYDIRNIKLFACIPPMIYWAVLPVLSHYYLSRFGVVNSAAKIFTQVQIFIPVISALPIIFVLKSYVENDGHEVLYTFSSVRRYGFISILIIFLSYVFLTTPLFIYYACVFGNIWWDFFRTVIQSFFFASLGYSLVYLTRSTLAAFLGVIVVGSGMMLTTFEIGEQGRISQMMSIFSRLSRENPHPVEAEKYAVVFAVGIVLFLLGSWKNRNYFS